MPKIRDKIRNRLKKIFYRFFPELKELADNSDMRDYPFYQKNILSITNIQNNSIVNKPYKLFNCSIGSYTYIAPNSIINNSNIGSFCSIGPNLICGWGIHPTNGISTSPMFYSTQKQNGYSLTLQTKVEETKHIVIGNDVFIGMNVTILDGISIGDGAVIGAGTIVSKSIPPYAIAIGNPVRILRYRFNDETIGSLQKIKWWNWDYEQLKEVEKYFFDIEYFTKMWNK